MNFEALYFFVVEFAKMEGPGFNEMEVGVIHLTEPVLLHEIIVHESGFLKEVAVVLDVFHVILSEERVLVHLCHSFEYLRGNVPGHAEVEFQDETVFFDWVAQGFEEKRIFGVSECFAVKVIFSEWSVIAWWKVGVFV